MDAKLTRHGSTQIYDQENFHSNNGKGNIALPPTKRHGQSTIARDALGDINSNVQARRDVNKGKVAEAAAEYEKKATLNRNGVLRSNYSHVQSKIDTGLPKNAIQSSSRSLLRREESTAALALRAAARTRVHQKENKNKCIESKEVKKKDTKKASKLQCLKESIKEPKCSEKLTLIEPTESLGKLKLAESKSYTDQSTALVDSTKIETLETSSLIDITSQLPKDIEDIDAGDDSSQFLLSVYIKDIYKYLTELENKYPIEPDFLKNQAVITARMRATLIDWLVEVQHQFSLLLETFHLTVGIIDRYLQEVHNVQRNQLQLVGVTAMFIASKYEEVHPPDVGDFVYVTDNAYTKADIFHCERKILKKLGFSLARPIPLSFLRRFVKAAHGTSKQHHLAKYFVDLCLMEYTMAHYKPSELAASALCLSLYLLSANEFEDIWTPALTYYSTYSFGYIQPIIKKIAKIVIDVEQSKYQAVYKKYSSISLAKVSSLTQLKGPRILELARSP